MAIGSAAVEGFALSIGLILALGPQNVFVMRQGLMKSHVFAVCLTCSIFDAALITAGVLGMGSFLSGIEGAEKWIAVGASMFLGGYGLLRNKSAINPVGMSTDGEGEGDLRGTIGAAAASFVFFFSLGYGARSLSEILNKPKAWRYIDLSIACIMFIIAAAIMQPHL